MKSAPETRLMRASESQILHLRFRRRFAPSLQKGGIPWQSWLRRVTTQLVAFELKKGPRALRPKSLKAEKITILTPAAYEKNLIE